MKEERGIKEIILFLNKKESSDLKDTELCKEDISFIKKHYEEIMFKIFESYSLQFEVVKVEEKIIDIKIKEKELNKINLQDLSNKILVIISSYIYFEKGQKELKRRNLFDSRGYINPELEFYFHLSE